MTSTPEEPQPDPEVVPSGDPAEPIDPDRPGQDPGADPDVEPESKPL